MTPKINWKPDQTEIRKFGAVFLIGFVCLGALSHWRGHINTSYWLAGSGLGIGLLAILIPALAKPFYWAWMGIAWVMGSIMSRVVMSLIFFIVLTPVAILFKLIRRDALRLKRPSDSEESFWIKHERIDDPNYYNHLY